MAKRKTAVPPTTPKGVRTDGTMYALGPQQDGSYVIRFPDDFSLMILRKAIERHEKNVNAAGGTLSPLFDGPDVALQKAQQATAIVKNLIVMARSPEDQVSDTPIGDAIAEANARAGATSRGKTSSAASSAPREPVDGREDGTAWAAHVPHPRPKIGQYVRHPGGEASSVESIGGYDDTTSVFVVETSQGQVDVVAHQSPSGELEWRGVKKTTKGKTPAATGKKGGKR